MNTHVEPDRGPARGNSVAANAGEPLAISMHPHPGGLRVEVDGEGTLANTIAYWELIVDHVRRHEAKFVLLIDRMTGPALTAEQWRALVQAMEGQGLEGVRIAHVKPHGLQEVEYCEIYALEAGIDAMVFEDEHLGDLWLRHPEHRQHRR
ncbi:hypothetical protein [Lysobacter niastensis]|uniref:STAS/SEC14 domain-containing protein n=1 Tax=Lysobacter niastensis TaxID=380629 RepID=A0ABS0BE32_9GAMM|nr:hypothetical protein [Lysobacter niastensis]MBF6025274.1 hypothetical protein [Lysobacter niastensis]